MAPVPSSRTILRSGFITSAGERSVVSFESVISTPILARTEGVDSNLSNVEMGN
jgi:hypothetical protein